MKTVLLTGSQGFIGSYICRDLLANGYKVIGVDNFSKYGEVKRWHDTHPNFSLIKHDCRDLHNIPKEQFKDVDYIIAGAAMIGGISYFHKFAYDLVATNERILAATFDTAIELFKNHALKRVIALSSSMVYESTNVYPTPEIEVTRCPPPLSTYGFQKLAVEYFCKGAFEQYKVPYTIIRPFNCVGVGEEESSSDEKITVGNQKLLMSHVLPDLVYRALTLKPTDPLPILGTGEQIRQYTNGKDIARGIRLAMESDLAINQDFNISHSKPTTVKELANVVWKVVHNCEVKEFKSLDPFEYDVQKRVSDTTKAKNLLNFEATIDLEQSVREVVEWMRNAHINKETL